MHEPVTLPLFLQTMTRQSIVTHRIRHLLSNQQWQIPLQRMRGGEGEEEVCEIEVLITERGGTKKIYYLTVYPLDH